MHTGKGFEYPGVGRNLPAGSEGLTSTRMPLMKPETLALIKIAEFASMSQAPVADNDG